MLKRLELLGFKSFAEKTRFDFPPGITAVVGPNGSGKSNVVDAVRWVLGEQSAKSLRGGEMTDVIFNGSSTRKSLGLAEVTLTFDNSPRASHRDEQAPNLPAEDGQVVSFLIGGNRPLNTELDEVQITRRVYRDGEGEYLINNRPCRLKDVKDLFLGSGAGAHAYSIIEQGRVDALLQASTRDRRAIFEEAAGISRFRARKQEALRRLERVEQNLQRLRDILTEVEKQLRAVRLQASKAQRFQEHTARLKELRVGLGLREFHSLTEQWHTASTERDRLRAGLSEAQSLVAAWEDELRQLEGSLAQREEVLREQENRLASARQQIASDQATLAQQRGLTAGREDELARDRRRRAELAGRLTALAVAADKAERALADAAGHERGQRESVQHLAAELAAVQDNLDALRQQVETGHAEHLERRHAAARLQNDVVAARFQVEQLQRERERLHTRSAQAVESLATLDVELDALARADQDLQARIQADRQRLADHARQQEEWRRQAEQVQRSLAELRELRSGLASRVEVLEGLEHSREGLSTGVREVFALLEGLDPAESSPWRTVVGLVADLLTVPRDLAPLIDLALGETAQRFLVRDPALLDLALLDQPFTGRVSFLPLRAPFSSLGEPKPPTVLPAGAVRADQLVRSDAPDLADLPARLLATTLLVPDLATARAAALRAPGCRFVTRQGELLEADGTLTVGTRSAADGLLSRKSELRELRQQAEELEQRIAAAEQSWADLRGQADALEAPMRALAEGLAVLTEQAGDLRSRIGQQRDRRAGLHEEVALSRGEIDSLEQEIARLETEWAAATQRAEIADREAAELQTRLVENERSIRAREQDRQRLQQERLSAEVALAQGEERLAGLRDRHARTANELAERRQEAALLDAQIGATKAALTEAELLLLGVSARLAAWFHVKEQAERAIGSEEAGRDRERERRQELSTQMQAVRSAWQEQQQQAHDADLRVRDLEHRRTTLTDRLREDYQIELGDLYEEIQPPRTQRENREGDEANHNDFASPSSSLSSLSASSAFSAVNSLDAEEEIAELRRKLSRLGSVSLESLQELTETEARSAALQTQHDDLTAAQRTLQEIIDTINTDSRRLFTATFAAIRTHFQELFRMLFGGGMADVVLETEVDVLESGIEVVARPPGKELRSISLLSGGEKTLTAVALLLAIFRSKPSPFCLLDEVDAALDEANTARLSAVLREFLDRSQFIVVTHHKRTMASADVLYGITMQESGVSKQVAVKFEDWPEEEQAAAA